MHKTGNFSKWFSRLKARKAKARIQARIDRLGLADLGDVSPVGEGVSELRIHYGPGYRVYFGKRGNLVVFLLLGGDKTTQKSDIKYAKSLAKQLED